MWGVMTRELTWGKWVPAGCDDDRADWGELAG